MSAALTVVPAGMETTPGGDPGFSSIARIVVGMYCKLDSAADCRAASTCGRCALGRTCARVAAAPAEHPLPSTTQATSRNNGFLMSAETRNPGSRLWLGQDLRDFPRVAGWIREGRGAAAPRPVGRAVEQLHPVRLKLRAHRIRVVYLDGQQGARAAGLGDRDRLDQRGRVSRQQQIDDQ